jgi:Xaa-Pro aminopeptidase
MIDHALVLNGYHFDETRMFAIDTMPADAMKACRAAIDIHDTVLEAARPGVRLGALFDLSVARAEALGVSKTYLGPPGYKVSFVAHGIGLELVEPPIISAGSEVRLEPGMVFALEPKMISEGRFTAGIESVFTVTETGCRLMSRTPVEIFIC